MIRTPALFDNAMIPEKAQEEMKRIGFVQSFGTVNVTDKRGYVRAAQRYWWKHATFPVVLLGESWFYNTTEEKWIHPDHLHDHLERLVKKKSAREQREKSAYERHLTD